jgi:hypothetical protein
LKRCPETRILGRKEIVVSWVDELQKEHLFGPNDPLFPRTAVSQGAASHFKPQGLAAAVKLMRNLMKQEGFAPDVPD